MHFSTQSSRVYQDNSCQEQTDYKQQIFTVNNKHTKNMTLLLSRKPQKKKENSFYMVGFQFLVFHHYSFNKINTIKMVCYNTLLGETTVSPNSGFFFSSLDSHRKSDKSSKVKQSYSELSKTGAFSPLAPPPTHPIKCVFS